MRILTIKYSPKTCTGVGKCVEHAAAYFKLENQKAELLGGTLEGDDVIKTVEVDEEQEKQIIAAGKNCPVNAIGVVDTETGEELVSTSVSAKNNAEVKAIPYTDDDFRLDPKGYFLIRVLPEEHSVEIAHCREVNVVDFSCKGQKPQDLYWTCVQHDLFSFPEHAAYLGKELHKAFTALELGLEYVQDSELDLKSVKK